MEGNLHFKVSWASLTLGRKFTVFLCFTLYLRAISKSKPPGGGGAHKFGGWEFNGRFFCYKFGGLLFGGAYFQNFTGLIFRRGAGGWSEKCGVSKLYPFPPK